jgi:hypothetical protein
MKLLIDAVSRKNIRETLEIPDRSPFDSSHRAWHLTGSDLLTKTVFTNKYTAISIYPSYYFIPRHYTGRKYTGLARSFGDQFWGSTIGSPFYGYDGEKFKAVLSSALGN